MGIFSQPKRNSEIIHHSQDEDPLPPTSLIHQDWPANDTALLELGSKKTPQNRWTLGDAFEGVSILGGTGSGKTSGSGKALAKSFLRANMGGLILTSKKDELQNWLEYFAETNRPLDDLIIFSPDEPYRFNFLRYELERKGEGAGQTENLVNLFCSVLEVAERRSGQGGGGNDSYWQRTLKQLLRNAIDLAIIASEGGDLDLPSLYRIITTAPQSMEQVIDDEWMKRSDCFALLGAAEDAAPKIDREIDFQLTRDYWLDEFPNLAPETRSVIVSTFTSMADCFLRGNLRKLFCSELNLTPESCFEGKIIILNLPVKEYQELGQFAQTLFKFCWQRAVERRINPQMKREMAEASIRPVFLWADEAQFFVNSYDAQFQGTARSSRASTVYLTQNLPSYFSVFGGQNSRYDTEAFLGNLQTKIFHGNGDPTTNNWAADSIGKSRQFHINAGMGEGSVQNQSNQRLNQSSGANTVIEYTVQPREFTTMRSGGPENSFLVDSIIFQGGRSWLSESNGTNKSANYIRSSFHQLT